MGQKMSNPPIFYTLAQIRFSAVLGMGKYVDSIQERLRGSYPDFRTEQRRTLHLADTGEASELKSEATVRWHFADQSNTSGFILDQSSLIFHTTAYETSDWFFDQLLHGLEVVHAVASLGYIQRLGLRTLDIVVPDAGESLEIYLQKEALGFYRLLPGELKHNITEAVFSVGSGMLISRLIVMKGLLALPADLVPISLTLPPNLQSLNALHAVLDVDRNEESKMPVNTNDIRKKLASIKRDTTETFERTVTPEALNRWS
jgi:uncharacterized protein (TIGR04255 family)